MKDYAMALGAGLIVGVFYGLVHIRSPAPPVIALVGLFGMLLGEQLPPVAANLWRNRPLAHAWLHHVKPHVFGQLPGASEPKG